ncbi:MAG: TetR/AcrR family transcriptional regulator [Ktedonobacteraceae bacterium]
MNSEDARQSLKEKQRQERENLIMQAAERMLLEKGYYEMAMDEIAAQVGIAKSTVYHHFPSKEDLVIALIERKMTQFFNLIVETMNQELSAREKLDIIFQRMYIQRAAIHRGQTLTPLPLLISLYNSAGMHSFLEKSRGRMGELVLLIRSRLLALLKEGQQAGDFDDVLPPDVMLGCFFSMITPLTYERLATERQLSLDELVKYTKCMYFRSIAASVHPECV